MNKPLSNKQKCKQGPVLVFNKKQVLVAIFSDIQSCSNALKFKHISLIHDAIRGKLNTSGGYYFKIAPSDIEFEDNDIESLTLTDFNSLNNDGK